MKSETLQRILRHGLAAILRAEGPDDALRMADACREGGIEVLEVTFTVPGARRVIAELARRMDGVLIGAGTVLDSETARIAQLEGARFIAGPSVDAPTARLANRYAIPYIPGAATASEIVRGMELGAELVKVFPGETLGPGFVRAVRGPLPQARLMPTGGVSADNAREWIEAGAAVLGAGGQLTRPALDGDYAGVTDNARRLLAAIREARP